MSITKQVIAVAILVGCLLVGCQSLHALQDARDGATNYTFDQDCCSQYQQIVREKILLLTEKPTQIGIIVFDLNDDGRRDFFAQLTSSLYCGTSGCTLHIFVQNQNGSYAEVRGPTNTYQSLKILKTKTGGMHDLVFQGKSNNEECLWTWNSHEYTFQQCQNKKENT